MDWIMDMFINLCLLIDNMIYSVNVLLFKLFLAVSNGKFVDSVFHEFFARLYVIIGIFMIFKVAFSLIQMLSNPDLMTDKEKGAGKLASQIVIALGLIIMVPTIFTMAFDLQSAVLSENIIGKLLFGGTFDENDNTGNINENTIDTQGRFIAITVFKGMITIPDEIIDSGDSAVSACNDALKSSEYSTIDSLRKVNNNIDCFTYQVQDKRIYDYKILVSSIATGMVAWLMVGFCIDVAVRLFKLGALELIAPICIVTYVGGGKDNAFNKWTKLTISTYVSVFIKLITIYFVIYFAGIIGDRDTLIINTEVPLVNVALILGLLVFAKNAPKLIGDLFGVQPEEESGFKSLAKVGLLAGAAKLAGKGAQIGASKLGGGLLAMKHGKPFSEGAAGGWKKERQAGRDMRLEQRKAAHDEKTRTENYNKGKEIADNMAGIGGTEEDKLKAQFGDKYGSSMFRSDAAKKAKFAAERNQELAHDRAKTAQQSFNGIRNKTSVNSALSKIDNYKSQIEALKAQGVADNDSRIIGMQSGISNQEQVLRNEGYYDAESNYQKAMKEMQDADIALGDATKIYDDLKARHEELQKIDREHAKMEQQLDTYKLVEKGGGL